MKNRSLKTQIGITFILSFIIFIMLFTLLNGFIIQRYFKNKNYSDIEAVQGIIVDRFDEGVRGILDSDMYAKNEIQDYRAVQHIVLVNGQQMKFIDKFKLPESRSLSEEALDTMKRQTLEQDAESMRYYQKYGDTDLYYSIYKRDLKNAEVSLISYRLINASELLESSLMYQLIIGAIITILFSVVLTLIIANYLTRPLVRLEEDVSLIAKKEWDKPIVVDRGDEIGKLGASIENMRRELKAHEESQQSSLQYISHELKTPVMIIRSYAQSIEDGIYPKGNLVDTVKVIDKEALRLEKRIKDLLFFTKMDYVSKHSLDRESIDLKDLIEHVIEKFEYNRRDLVWIIDIKPLCIDGNYDQWNVVLENILDNQIKYAKSSISIKLNKEESYINVQISNDGEAIEQSVLDRMFTPYRKGKKGSNGLGLAIVKKVVEVHGGTITAKNNKNGVSFIIRIMIENK